MPVMQLGGASHMRCISLLPDAIKNIVLSHGPGSGTKNIDPSPFLQLIL